MSDLKAYKEKQLKNPEFKAEYDRIRPEYEEMRYIIEAQIRQDMTRGKDEKTATD